MNFYGCLMWPVSRCLIKFLSKQIINLLGLNYRIHHVNCLFLLMTRMLLRICN
ncbi:hypothetical protein RDABS01_011479 [Bienertia sinuspersici]